VLRLTAAMMRGRAAAAKAKPAAGEQPGQTPPSAPAPGGSPAPSAPPPPKTVAEQDKRVLEKIGQTQGKK
jgi:hypothetical protein